MLKAGESVGVTASGGGSAGAPRPSIDRPESPEGAPILARTPDPDGARGDGKPAHQRPELPEFWNHRFAAGTLPWDAGGVPARLAQFARDRADRPTTLIPGCGSAHEAAHLDRLGWPVCAIDFAPAAIASAAARLEGFRGELRCADFFDFAAPQPFDLIYERAFRCALPRKLWPGYAPRCAALLRPGGLLAGFFHLGSEPKGPPFPIEADRLEALLGPWFEKIEDEAVSDSIRIFAGSERWQLWRRRDDANPA